MSQCRIERRDFRGWQAVYLENDLITLVAVPDISGRIMAYDLGLYAYIYVDRTLAGKLFTPEEHQGDGSLTAWKNYGGTRRGLRRRGGITMRNGPAFPMLSSIQGAITSTHLAAMGRRPRSR